MSYDDVKLNYRYKNLRCKAFEHHDMSEKEQGYIDTQFTENDFCKTVFLFELDGGKKAKMTL